jgi:hypothetical protein
MVEFLNYLQERDKMVREFKFFRGLTIESEGIQDIVRRLQARWTPDLNQETIDAEEELTRVMSEEIARGIDQDIIRTITRRINGGGDDNIRYLNHWMDIGNNRA